jgi:hypothetical protein
MGQWEAKQSLKLLFVAEAGSLATAVSEPLMRFGESEKKLQVPCKTTKQGLRRRACASAIQDGPETAVSKNDSNATSPLGDRS